MTRQWRIEYEGALYHVMSRGNDGRQIAKDDHDRQAFLELLGKMSSRFGNEIYGYVLMDNHYHLLLRTRLGQLSRGMQWLGQTYTRQYNLRHRRSGHLFQGRFKSFLVEDDRYLLGLSCYIHRNPLRAGMVRRLVDYRWSSYPAYAYGRKKPDWLKTEVLLGFYFRKNRHAEYRKQVQEYSKEEKKVWEDVKHGLFMGSPEFIEKLRKRYLKKQDKEMPQQRQVLKGEGLRRKIWEAAESLGLEMDKLRQRGRVKAHEKESRDVLVYLLWENGIYTNAEIGELFGLSYSAVSKQAGLLQLKLLKDKQLKRKYDEVKSLFKM